MESEEMEHQAPNGVRRMVAIVEEIGSGSEPFVPRIHPKGFQEILERFDRELAAPYRLAQRHKDRMLGLFPLISPFQLPLPVIKKLHPLLRDHTPFIGDIISSATIRIDAKEVRTYLTRDQARAYGKILVMTPRQPLAPSERLFYGVALVICFHHVHRGTSYEGM